MSRVRWLLAATAADIAGCGWLIAATWHLGYWHGLYCAAGTAATVGCDTVPATAAGRLAHVAAFTAVPLLAAVFGQLHLDRVDRLVGAHHKTLRDRLDRIERRGSGPAGPAAK